MKRLFIWVIGTMFTSGVFASALSTLHTYDSDTLARQIAEYEQTMADLKKRKLEELDEAAEAIEGLETMLADLNEKYEPSDRIKNIGADIQETRDDVAEQRTSDENSTIIRSPRFLPYGFNYIVFTAPTSYDHSDFAFEGQVSLRYNISDSGHTFMHFTNRFDFYAGARNSSPVVIRDEKIGLDWDLRSFNSDLPLNLETIYFGFTHWSNGQVINVTDNPTANDSANTISRAEYTEAYNGYNTASDSSGYRELVDSLSRSRNYLTVTPLFKFNNGINLAAEFKIPIIDQEETVWGNIDPDATFSDYDVMTIAASSAAGKGIVAAQIRLGKKLLAGESYDLSYHFSKSSPWFVKYHHGPFQRLSDYTREINVLSFGFEMTM